MIRVLSRVCRGGVAGAAGRGTYALPVEPFQLNLWRRPEEGDARADAYKGLKIARSVALGSAVLLPSSAMCEASAQTDAAAQALVASLPGLLPYAVVVGSMAFVVQNFAKSTEAQVKSIKDSTDAQVKSMEKQVASIQDSTEAQVKSIRDSSDEYKKYTNQRIEAIEKLTEKISSASSAALPH